MKRFLRIHSGQFTYELKLTPRDFDILNTYTTGCIIEINITYDRFPKLSNSRLIFQPYIDKFTENSKTRFLVVDLETSDGTSIETGESTMMLKTLVDDFFYRLH